MSQKINTLKWYTQKYAFNTKKAVTKELKNKKKYESNREQQNKPKKSNYIEN